MLRKVLFYPLLFYCSTAFPSAVEVLYDEKHDLSPVLKTIPPKASAAGIRIVVPNPEILQDETETHRRTDPVIQSWMGSTLMPSAAQNFEGIAAHGFIPPDTNGEAGRNHYVQMVNRRFAVFDKAGKVVYGPVDNNTLWTGFGGICESTNQGDPIVVYDQLADRWVLSQFANTGPGSHMECIAISETDDPTGRYYRYAYAFPFFNDYPKIGVWPNGYYSTYFLRHPDFGLADSRICAFDRKKMLKGEAASAQCFDLGRPNAGLLPADLDGSIPPPKGSPHFSIRVSEKTNTLDLWKLKINWTKPGRSKLVGPKRIPIAPFLRACRSTPQNSCIEQRGVSKQLHAFSDRLMFRLAYRNFGTHQSLVTNHTVQNDQGISGIRWYEIRSPRRKPILYQQGTYLPDNNHRWMGSVAMDSSGNMAVGFSLSGKKIFPSIAYAGRSASDPKGLLPLGEEIAMKGKGSQVQWNRWGDYSAMTIDPVDDCTFWYTTEYLRENGDFNWRTRILSFRFPDCER